ncbi:MAG: RagB/SusD family nutrient uptake outer membrane protein [Saprospiraceae bacterium]|nr:RagB/SusD family nutrient uptake outer membrane protein [Saprospiraceae bacterium]
MKAFSKIYLFCLIILACDDELDISPTLYIETSIALSTDQGVKTALVGVYEELSIFWSGQVQSISELLGSDSEQSYNGFSNGLKAIFTKEILSDNKAVFDIWKQGFKTINAANQVLSAIDVVEEQADQDRITGEARFIRAAVYFELINLFARSWQDGDPAVNPGLPWVNEPTSAIQASLFVARNTVHEIYSMIIKDLTMAKELLPETNGFRASTYTASAILSRVYLMQNKWELVEEECTRIIDADRFMLIEDFGDVFNQSDNTSEDLFTIIFTPQEDNQNAFIELYAARNRGGNQGQIAIPPSYLERYDSNDGRLELFYLDPFMIYRTGKWITNSNSDGNVNIIRFAEVYLNRSEARYRLDNRPGAAGDLNVIRRRAHLPDIGDEALNLELVRRERDLELNFEGHLLRDKKRFSTEIGGLPANSDQLVLPIPEIELEVNPNLEQNPGY